MSDEKKRTKIDPAKIIVKGPSFEYRKQPVGLGSERTVKKAAKKAAKKK